MPTRPSASRLLAAILLALTLGLARAEVPQSVVAMKDGKISFTVLSPDGVKPISGMELTIQAPEGKDPVASAKTNDKGECEVEVKPGNYILALGGVAVSQLSIGPDAKTTHLRLVTPTAPAAQVTPPADGNPAAVPAPEEEKKRKPAAFWWSGGNTLKTALLIGGAVATGIIIYENNDDDGSDPTPAELRRAALLKVRPGASPALIGKFEALSDAQFQEFLALSADQQGSFADGLVSSSPRRETKPKPSKPKPVSN